ncbi:hypothetical protein N7488_002740 [Penicillium malachiteum]|nr:hypothetical protein N7488_002740 [Penicillium malachiteum]
MTILIYSQVDSLEAEISQLWYEQVFFQSAEPEPLSELVTSAQFQLADRTLRRSGEGEAFGFHTTGSTDNEPAETLAEYFPKNPPHRDENVPENDYSWMEDYLDELWFRFGELADDGEQETGTEGAQVEQTVPL